MTRTWKDIRRLVKARARYALDRHIGPQDIQRVLDLMTPYTVDRPLIRVGGSGDGGYLVPQDLDGIVACFSPGVSETMTFDTEIMDRGIPSYFADASVEGLVDPHPLATFDRLFLGPKTEGIFITLDDWVSRYAPPQGDLILQMDIEGAEYSTLTAASDETLNRFRIIVMEVHRLEQITQSAGNAAVGNMLERLNRNFVLAHAHPNNFSAPMRVAGCTIPPLLELTYLRRDRVTKSTPSQQFPHPLDEPNVPDRPDLPLPRYWR